MFRSAIGTTRWTSVPTGSLGGLQLARETGPLPDSVVIYGYDALGRIASRGAGKVTEDLQYDAIGRLVQDTNPLGTFTISYLGETAQPTERQVNGGSPITWGYLGNIGDRRLASINNDNLAQYTVTTTPENLVTGVTVTRPTTYPAAGTETASYNNLNQLTSLSGQALTYDADGNLLSDGTRNYTWDAENRLVGITFPAEPGQQVAFTYDGLGRRVEITSTPAGGSPTTTTYTWCGFKPCVASNSNGTVARRYYAEGEQVLSSNTGLYYGQDQIGSARDVLVLPSNTSQTYDYGPYGNALQTPATGPLTDIRFAGMFFEPNSGLCLTRTRV